MNFERGFTVRISRGGAGAAVDRYNYRGYAHAVDPTYVRVHRPEFVRAVCFAMVFTDSLTGTWSSRDTTASPECAQLVSQL